MSVPPTPKIDVRLSQILAGEIATLVAFLVYEAGTVGFSQKLWAEIIVLIILVFLLWTIMNAGFGDVVVKRPRERTP